MNDTQSIEMTYPTYFADYRRSSFIPVAARAKGNIAVSQGLIMPGGGVPRYIILWGSRPVLETETGFAVYDSDGKRLWERAKFQDSPIGLGNNLLYYENENFFLNAVDINNRLAFEDASLPNVLDESYSILLFAPQKDYYMAVVQFAGGPDGSPPTARPFMAKYEDRLTEWGFSLKGGQSLLPLFLPEIKRLIIFMKEIICLDAGDGKEIGRFKFPIDSPFVCSADAKGNLYFLGSDGRKSTLVAMAPDGNEIWRFASPLLGALSFERQPPILGVNGLVYTLAGNTILAVKEGKMAWSIDFPDGGLGYGTALADGSLLFTAGRLLVLLDQEGKQIFAIDMEEALLTPPVVDNKGRIYVASAKTLFRID